MLFVSVNVTQLSESGYDKSADGPLGGGGEFAEVDSESVDE
jgi:hypothetical protein